MALYSLDLFPESPLPDHAYVLPSAAPMQRCRACGMPLVVATLPSGASVPLSLATTRQHGRVWIADSHFQDCPTARRWLTRSRS